jgi:hypothetical protein
MKALGFYVERPAITDLFKLGCGRIFVDNYRDVGESNSSLWIKRRPYNDCQIVDFVGVKRQIDVAVHPTLGSPT